MPRSEDDLTKEGIERLRREGLGRKGGREEVPWSFFTQSLSPYPLITFGRRPGPDQRRD